MNAWRATLIACVAAMTACARPSAPGPQNDAPARPPELRWYRDLALDGVGGDPAVLHVDPKGGLWAAIAGVSQPEGVSRLFHRVPGGVWREVRRGPYATELSLSSVRGGEVYFGFNLPFSEYRPTLLRVTDEEVEPLAAPAERLDEREYVQVGGYALLADGSGWACGQRGRMWRRSAGAWRDAAPVLPWHPGDPANASYCASLTVRPDGKGELVDFDGNGAWLDGSWRRLPADGSLVSPANGLAFGADGLARYDGATFRPLARPRPRTPSETSRAEDASEKGALVFDATGLWAASPSAILALEGESVRALTSELHVAPRAVAFADESLWVLAADGIWRATREQVPTFAAAPPGAIPSGIAFSLAVDLDGDGHDDLVGLSPRDGSLGSATVTAFISDGHGRFVPRALGIPTKLDRWRDRIDAGDLDGDGDVDLVLAGADGQVEVWRQEGSRFSLFFTASHPGAVVALVDVDADGDLDLSVIPARAGVLLNDGTGRFPTQRAVPFPPRFGVERATWGDLDGDGLPDAVLQHWRDPAHLLHNLGDHFALLVAPFPAEGAAIVDVDGDGTLDLLGQMLHVRAAAQPFSRCFLDRAAFLCALESRTAIPGGLVVDLDLDGTKDVIVADLRGDEHMTDEGEVRLARGRGDAGEARFEAVTWATGLLPQATVLDADGDGDPDVYSTTLGLRINTGNPTSFVRVRPRASTSDRRASGAIVLVTDATTHALVSTARAERGSATLGLPDTNARYDVEVRFPAGGSAFARGVSAGADLEIRDAAGARWLARLAALWVRGTVTLARPRDVVPLALALLVLGALAARRRALPAGLSPLRLGGLVVLTHAGALGVALREGGVAALLPLPFSLACAVAVDGAIAAVLARRAARRAGPYLLLEKLGQGAAAAVWRAQRGRSEVALKLFDAEAMTVSESRERFFREARVGGEISHPNVVKIRDSGLLPDGRCYLAMDLVEGGSLGALLARGRLAPARAARIAKNVADALTALHAAGVLHRDVKPENVMIRRDGSAVLTDLGLARSTLFRTMTRHDVAVGTLAYMSPEQCVGRPLDGATDIWSLGVTLYEMVTGTRPFVAEHELELVYMVHNVDPEPPSARAPEVSPELEAVILRCLERIPEQRFRNAAALAAALETMTDG